jgi:hypothetical protein
VRVQDSHVAGQDDPDVLAWAAAEGRLLLTHDISTMVAHATHRLERGEPMAGIVEVPANLPIGRAIDELELLVRVSDEREWSGQILFLPL